jgi:hypothetical protein
MHFLEDPLAAVLDASRDAAWLRIQPTPASSSPSRHRLGSPGLWKKPGRNVPPEFAIPAAAWSRGPAPDDDEVRDAAPVDSPARRREAALGWARVTWSAPGTLAAWEPPDPERLDALAPSVRRHVRRGPLLREIELVRQPGRLAWRLRLATLHHPLPAGRRHWLNRFVRDASSQWPLARFGLSADRRLVAETDLTGIPGELLPVLFPAGLDTLRWIAVHLAETAEWLAAMPPASRSIPFPPVR